MEAVPRLPMVSFELLTTSEKVAFGSKLKQYIAGFYQEDPESYNNEIHTLEGLRASAVWPSIDITNCQIMKKYYCQLFFLKSRFPMEEGQAAAVYFSWKDEYTKMSSSVPDINFEQMCLLINIGAIHSKLGAEDSRTTPEGMKLACTHFQCAAWAFEQVRDIYGQLVGLVMISSHQIRGMQLMCLAQAQECILEKSLLDNRKATIIAKIAMQLSEYYRDALMAFQTGDDGLVIEHLPNYKYVLAYLLFKIAYTSCIALLYQGQHLEEQQKMGERVTFYNSAVEALENARKHLGRMSSSSQGPFKDTLTFALDVVEGKRKAATNENEFIYHEDVPHLHSLPEIKGASLVKGIPFNVHDSEVSGADIFGRLVPMEAHEASSLYSEQKAQMLRQIGERVDEKDKELNEFMSSMQFDILSQMKSAKGLSQDLVDRAAAMVAKPNATKELVEAMGKLSNTYHEVEAMLNECQGLLKEEEHAEKEYQAIMGKRPSSIIATDLSREAAKYQEAHGKASESNQNLHKAMTTHIANLKVLAQPLAQLRAQIPSIQIPDAKVDDKAIDHIQSLVAKVDEMKAQRMNLWTQLRDAIHKDDITTALVTRQPDQPLDVVFQQELEKHRKVAALIDQNMAAQENICKAIVEAYAKFTPTRNYLQEILNKRNNMIAALIGSYDAYDDLLAKANKGIEFYIKLETNAAKLLQRIKSACKVQQEEREQILMKNGHITLSKDEDVVNEIPISNKPKLKDYLNSMKGKTTPDAVIGPQMQYPVSSMYPEYIPPQTGYSQQYNNSITSSAYGSHGYTQVNYSDKNIDHSLVDKMNAMKIPPTNFQYDYSNSQAYNYPVSYTAAVTTYAASSTNLPVTSQINSTNYSNPPSSYQTVSNTNYPYITTSEQYEPISEVNRGLKQNTVSYTTTSTTPALTTDTTNSGYNYFNQQPYGYPAPNGQYLDNYKASYGYDNGQYNAYSTQNPYPKTTTPSNYPYNQANVYPPQDNTYRNTQSTYDQTKTNTYNPTNQDSNVYNQANTFNQQGNNSVPNVYNPANAFSQQANNVQCNTYNPQDPYNQVNNVYPSQINNYSYQPVNSHGYNTAYNQVNPQTTSITTGYNQSNPTNIGSSTQIPALYNQHSYYQSNQQQNSVPTTTYSQVTATPNETNQIYNAQYSQNYYNASTQPQSTYINSQPQSTYINTQAQSSYNYNTPVAPKKESSVDLLAGLDFSISQAPLIPQKDTKKEETKPEIKEITSAKQPETIAQIARKPDKVLKKGEPFRNSETVKQFLNEVDKFDKYIEGLNVKTLSGPSNLELKWKEIKDCQDNAAASQRSISVARCYPLKNRSPDILPYDYSRVELRTTSDDYINASHVKDVNPYCMDFIVTQTPTHGTVAEFWAMIWEQHIETIVCLLSNSEIKEDVYWPLDIGKELNVAAKFITMLSFTEKEHWTERKLNLALPEQKEQRIITLLQFTAWPGSLFPTNPLPFVNFLKETITIFEQQKCTGNPLLVQCQSGVGRSGICVVLLAVLMEFAATAYPIPDIPSVTCKMSLARKNILRDREHLKFVYTALLSYLQMLKKDFTKCDIEKAEDIVQVPQAPIDPLSTLDPLWATKKI